MRKRMNNFDILILCELCKTNSAVGICVQCGQLVYHDCSRIKEIKREFVEFVFFKTRKT